MAKVQQVRTPKAKTPAQKVKAAENARIAAESLEKRQSVQRSEVVARKNRLAVEANQKRLKAEDEPEDEPKADCVRVASGTAGWQLTGSGSGRSSRRKAIQRRYLNRLRAIDARAEQLRRQKHLSEIVHSEINDR